MIDIEGLKREFDDCECGREHTTLLKDVCMGSGITCDTGEILKKNGFGKKLLLVADKNTLAAAEGIEDSLAAFDLRKKIYENLREATLAEVEKIKDILKDCDAVISVGTGSLNDICRMAAAKGNKPFAIYAIIIIGMTISLAGNPRIKAIRMTPSIPSSLPNGSRKLVQWASRVISPTVIFAISQIKSPAGAATMTALPRTNSVRSKTERTITLPIWGRR